jgi:hypothetical protein
LHQTAACHRCSIPSLNKIILTDRIFSKKEWCRRPYPNCRRVFSFYYNTQPYYSS